MAMRRPRGEDNQDGTEADERHHHRHGNRRIRPALSFRAVVRRAVAAETIQQIVHSLEPIIRRVVREEIQNICPQQQDHAPFRSLPLGTQELEDSPPPPLKLIFARRLKLPIFTNNKLVDNTNNALQIHLIDTRTNYVITPESTYLGSSLIRLEVLVLDGDFRYGDGEGWTVDQFNAATVRAREGKRPLLVGTLNVSMNNHGVAVIDDVSFTDNSSWIRSRKFRIGVRAMPTSYFGMRIQEAVSESFVVKDHRGELYKKHYPPSLTDNIWRLRNIGKEGPIVKRLESEGIKTVQDFLKLNTTDPDKLRDLVSMSEKQWNMTLDHAKTCKMGGKCYIFKAKGCEITFNPIGEVIAARLGGQTYPFHELHPQQRLHVRHLATPAYQQWDQLEELANDETLLSANESLNPRTNSGREGTESQGSMISSGSQLVNHLDSIGTPTASSAAAAIATNSSLTSDSTAAAASANNDMFWSLSPAPEDQFAWQNCTCNDLGCCWDEVD